MNESSRIPPVAMMIFRVFIALPVGAVVVFLATVVICGGLQQAIKLVGLLVICGGLSTQIFSMAGIWVTGFIIVQVATFFIRTGRQGKYTGQLHNDKQIVDSENSEKPSPDLIAVANYIIQCEEQDWPTEKIEQRLREANWSEDIICQGWLLKERLIRQGSPLLFPVKE